MQNSDHLSNVNMKYSIVLCVFVNSMIHGGMDNPVNNLPLYVRSRHLGLTPKWSFVWVPDVWVHDPKSFVSRSGPQRRDLKF
jgi:hypothetical protein